MRARIPEVQEVVQEVYTELGSESEFVRPYVATGEEEAQVHRNNPEYTDQVRKQILY